MTQPLKVSDLSIAYGGYEGAPLSVRNVSLEVEQGEILGIVGISGAGKSVLARAIVGYIEEPGRRVDGSIHVFGKDVQNVGEDELRRLRGRTIGIIVQNARAHLNPVLKVGTQIGNVYSAHFEQTSRKETRGVVLDMLAEVGIPAPDERYSAYPHEMSGGMAQRCMIAMAMVTSPRLLIADEPTSGLDVTIQDQILNLVRRAVRERESSGVLITRDMGIIANFCDRVAVMHEGEIVEADRTERFFTAAKHPVSQALVAAASYQADQQATEIIAAAGGPLL